MLWHVGPLGKNEGNVPLLETSSKWLYWTPLSPLEQTMPTPIRCNVFGCCLSQMREAHGLSQKTLAISAGLDTSYLAGIESGRRPLPRDRQLDRLATALGASNEEKKALQLALALSRAYQAGAALWAPMPGPDKLSR